MKRQLEVQRADVEVQGAQAKGAQDGDDEEGPANDKHDGVDESHDLIVSWLATADEHEGCPV